MSADAAATGVNASSTLRPRGFESTLKETFERICKHACDMIMVDHSGFVRFDEFKQLGEVVAEYPPLNGLLGSKIKLRGVKAEDDLLGSDIPLVIEDVRGSEDLDEVQELLERYDIRSICIVKVYFHGVVIGSFSFDSRFKTRKFTTQERALCRSFADLASKMIEHAQLAEWMNGFERATAAITSERDRDRLLDTLIEQADLLFGAQSVGIYLRESNAAGEDTLTLVASSDRDLISTVLPKGAGMAWRVIESNLRWLATDDYPNSEYKLPRYAGRFHSVLEVPLQRQQERIGVIYIADRVGRVFTKHDAELLRRFADVATLALQHTTLVGRLENLSKVAADIAGYRQSDTLDEKLTAIAMHTSKILNAEMCGVFLVVSPATLVLKASFGHDEGKYEPNRRFEIRNEPGSGLTGAVAARLIRDQTLHGNAFFNEWGDRLTRDPAVKGVRDAGCSGGCHSLLVVPLVARSGNRNEVIGMLRVSNKRGADGAPRDDIHFNEEDVWVLRIFAEAVVVAIDTAALFADLTTERNRYANLVSTWDTLASDEPLAQRLTQIAQNVVAVLKKSYCRILLADDSAESLTPHAVAHDPSVAALAQSNGEDRQSSPIVAWPELREALLTGKPYALPRDDDSDRTLRRLSRHLDFRDAVTGEPLWIQSLYSIPMVAGARTIGLFSIGELGKERSAGEGFTKEQTDFAEAVAAQATIMIDREQRDISTRRRALRFARLSEAVGFIRAQDDVVGNLAEVARQICAVFQCDFAGFLTQIAPGSRIELTTSNGRGTKPRDVSSVYELHALLSTALADAKEVTSRLSEALRHIPHIARMSSLLAVRFDYPPMARGVLFVGNRSAANHLATSDLDLLEILATHCATSLGRATTSEQLRRAMDGVNRVANDLAIGNEGRALKNVVEGIRRATNCAIVTLYRIRPSKPQPVIPTTAGLSDREARRHVFVPGTDSPVTRLLEHGDFHKAENASDDTILNGAFVERYGIVSAMGIPILWPEDPSSRGRGRRSAAGVLFVSYRTFHNFTDDDEKLIRMFARLAAVAIRNQDVFEREQRKVKAMRTLREATRHALAERLDLEQTIEMLANQSFWVAGSCVDDLTLVAICLTVDGVTRVVVRPPEAEDLLQERLGMDLALSGREDGRLGLVGRALKTGQTQWVNSVSEETEPDYIAVHDHTRSQVVVLIAEQLGVISIESADEQGFHEEFKETFELLASFALDAIRDARRRAELDRVRLNAERAAAWKQLSLDGAHMIRNPIFAIETNLLPLLKRLRESAVGEAEKIEAEKMTEEISVSLERAKGIIHEFGRLGGTEKYDRVAVPLRPMLEIACSTARSAGVMCSIECGGDVTVLGDALRLGECFDELVANAMLWFDKETKDLKVHVARADPRSRPRHLTHDREYFKINVRDNGAGVLSLNKPKIFTATFTTRDGGTGHGLAIVERIIENHEGAIAEVGVAGEGADFEIYLPAAPPSPASEQGLKEAEDAADPGRR